MQSSKYTKDDLVEDESHQIVSSLFMGPKAENFEWFKRNLIEILEAQRDARLDYFPRDGKVISDYIQESLAFRQNSRKMTNAIRQASRLLAKHSIPFWSPRYQGHMCMDLAMPALLGYFMTMIYNPNNVTIEASPLSTVAEIEVGKDFCKLFGYNIDPASDKPVAWGHITCDGTVANLESVWVARNLKFYPFSIRTAMDGEGPLAFIRDSFKVKTCTGDEKVLFELDTWETQNLRPQTILDIPERLYNEYYISPAFLNDVMKTYGIQTTNKKVLEDQYKIGDMKYFLSNTKHYSWPKSGAITGIGSQNVIGIKVDHGARVDLDDLRSQLQHCLDNKIGVYAVVAIIGSTEEGAVDPLAAILKMRTEFQDKGLSFLVHGDGAWGGYFCTMLPTVWQPGVEMPLPSEGGAHKGFVPDASLKTQTAEDLYALRYADSITVDPHKAAYIPYPAGGLCYKDGRMRYLVTWTSPYISRGETTDTSIGVFGVEGSKPGASVMSTWLSNACVGLHPNGYGKLLSEVTFTCSRLAAEWAAMSEKGDPFFVVPLNELPSEKAKTPPEDENLSDEEKEAKRQKRIEEERKFIREKINLKTNYELVTEDKDQKAMTLLRELGSDLNINAFAVNWSYEGGKMNDDVEEANYFNQRVIQDLSIDSPEDEPTKIPFYLTSTTFMIHEYGECAQHLKKRMGLIQDDTDLVVMRNVVMSPWPTDGNFINELINEYKKVMDKHVKTCRERNDLSAEKHEFLLQGTDKIYAVHFPMFNLEKHRRQLIFEVTLPDDAKAKYLDEKKFDPTGLFVLSTEEEIKLQDLAEGQTFKSELSKRLHKRDPSLVKKGEKIWAYNTYMRGVSIGVGPVVKHRSLKSRFRDRNYPSTFVPFYLYGTKKSLNIDHILVRSPNISMSADDITLSSDLVEALSDDALAKGCILAINKLSEAAMQPFQSTDGTLGEETMGPDSKFFFTPKKTFEVNVYEDDKAGDENGPGLVDFQGYHQHSTASSAATHGHANGVNGGAETLPAKKFTLLGSGQMTLGKGRYIDSVRINDDPFHIPEGNEKYKKWKEAFKSIGKELD